MGFCFCFLLVSVLISLTLWESLEGGGGSGGGGRRAEMGPGSYCIIIREREGRQLTSPKPLAPFFIIYCI